jgi:regulator of protease activity HflC (stomatin/prohibitin superfamily)
MVTEFALVASQASQAIGIGVVPIIVIVALVGFVGLILVTSTVKILKEYERGVVFRLGRVFSDGAKGPGLFFLIPIMDRMIKIDLRTVTMDVPPPGPDNQG